MIYSSYHSKESYTGHRVGGIWKCLSLKVNGRTWVSPWKKWDKWVVPLGKESVATSQDLEPKHASRDFKNKLRFSKDKNAILICNSILLPKYSTYAFIWPKVKPWLILQIWQKSFCLCRSGLFPTVEALSADRLDCLFSGRPSLFLNLTQV